MNWWSKLTELHEEAKKEFFSTQEPGTCVSIQAEQTLRRRMDTIGHVRSEPEPYAAQEGLIK